MTISYKTINDYSYGVIPVFKKSDNDKFLLIQHVEGHWSFPKGHKEKNESDVDTALRELREETGIIRCEIDSEKEFIEKFQYKKEDDQVIVKKVVKFYIGYVSSQKVKILPSEIKDYKWVKKDEAIKLLTYPETIKMFEEIFFKY